MQRLHCLQARSRCATVVAAPKSLDRRLKHVGVVDHALGQELQSKLGPGQRLVSREGHLWRWDGFTIAADVPTRSAKHLAERNRLQVLEKEIAGRRTVCEAARLEFATSQDAAATAHEFERGRRQSWRSAVAALDAARRSLQQQERESAARRQQMSAIEEAHRRLCESADEVRLLLAESEQRSDEQSTSEDLQADLQAQRQVVIRQQTLHAEARAHHDGIEREARLRGDRLQAIGAEKGQWSVRSRRTETQIAELKARVVTAQLLLKELSLMPGQIESRRTRMLSLLSQAEAGQREAADALAAGENRFRVADGELRAANERLSNTREQHARSGALTESGLGRQHERQRRIVEQFDCAPEELPRAAGFDRDALPAEDVIEHKLGQLRDERERLGAVNLLAEEEAAAAQQQLDGLKSERNDLVQAIAKLRGGIQNLNREGRQRLLDAFATVNRNFGALFTTLFSGGKAELQLVEFGRSPRSRARDTGASSRQETAGPVPAIRRRTGTNSARPHFCSVPHQPVANLRARRSRCAARRP